MVASGAEVEYKVQLCDDGEYLNALKLNIQLFLFVNVKIS